MAMASSGIGLGVGLLEYSSDIEPTQLVPNIRVLPMSFSIVWCHGYRIQLWYVRECVRRLQLLISTLPFCLTNGFRFRFIVARIFCVVFGFGAADACYERQCTGTHDTIYPQPHILNLNAMESFSGEAFAVAFLRLGWSPKMEIQLLLSSVHRIRSPSLARASVCECVALFYWSTRSIQPILSSVTYVLCLHIVSHRLQTYNPILLIVVDGAAARIRPTERENQRPFHCIFDCAIPLDLQSTYLHLTHPNCMQTRIYKYILHPLSCLFVVSTP